MNLLLTIFLLVLSIAYVPKFCYRCTEGFTLANIHGNFAYRADWEVKNHPLQEVFHQPFHYLASGGQCYVFLSKDEKYVLKLFKHKKHRIPLIIDKLPLSRHWAKKREKYRGKKLCKLERDFGSYKLAMENLPEETGLLYVHLNKSEKLHTKARIVDKLGIEHAIDLDQVAFVLQKKAVLAYSHLFDLIHQNDFSAAQAAIRSICDLILQRSHKGIYDEDAKIHRNFGFIENKAIVLDAGRFRIDPRMNDPAFQKKDLLKITDCLKKDLFPVSEELAQYLDNYAKNL